MSWALLNREKLLPTREQLAKAESVYARKKAQLRGKVELIWVLPDYYESFPKPCMGGWGRFLLTVSPNGLVLPCPVASSIKTLQFETVREHNLDWIWYESAAFNQFRGVEWLPEPCRSCDRRFQDYGGCRCQAFALTGDARQTDPVCQWAPNHHLVKMAVVKANEINSKVKRQTVTEKKELRRLTYRQL